METKARTGMQMIAPRTLTVAAGVAKCLRRSFAGWMLLGLILGSITPAAATPEYVLPTLFDVTGVAADDVLNVRIEPDTRATIIGTLSPRARNIEVVGYDASGRWARINTDESSGWVALRYLAYQVDVWIPGSLPPTLHCFGNEPFWSIRPKAELIEFSRPDAARERMRISEVLSTGLFRDPRRAFSAESESRRMTAVIVAMACTDGMSDRTYGLDVTVILEEAGTEQLLTGCCSIAPQ